MRELHAALLLVATLFAGGPASAKGGKKTPLYRIAVASVTVSPVRNKASFWDNFGDRKPDPKDWTKATNTKKLAKKITSLVAKSGEPNAMAIAVAAEAALHFGGLWTLKKVLPDPHGKLVVDRAPVIALRRINDTLQPNWPNSWSAPLALTSNSVVQLQLRDKDPTKSENIGNCTWTNLKLGKKTHLVHATHCSQPQLLSAVVVIQPAGAITKGVRVRAGRYKLAMVSIEVAATKARGQRWDIGGDPPDPRITIHVDGRKFYSCAKMKDEHNVVCNPDKELVVTRSTVIKLKVQDVDALSHDRIGEATSSRLIGRPVGKGASMTTTGQLNKAHFMLLPVR